MLVSYFTGMRVMNPSKIDTFYYGPQQVKGILTSSDLYNKVIRKKIL